MRVQETGRRASGGGKTPAGGCRSPPPLADCVVPLHTQSFLPRSSPPASHPCPYPHSLCPSRCYNVCGAAPQQVGQPAGALGRQEQRGLQEEADSDGRVHQLTAPVLREEPSGTDTGRPCERMPALCVPALARLPAPARLLPTTLPCVPQPWSGAVEALLRPLPADWRHNIQSAFSSMGAALGKLMSGVSEGVQRKSGGRRF